MLKIGVIGYGHRISSVVDTMREFGIPFAIVAISDPRSVEIKSRNDPFLNGTVFYDNEDDLLAKADIDGVMIGTWCSSHAPMACKAAKRNLPLFIEKPVAISFDQVKELREAFKEVESPTVVSFPLRLSQICLKLKEMIEADEIGRVEHVVAFNDVPYGGVYFWNFYRDYDIVGGLFLQKATHDLDCIQFLLDQQPVRLAAMNAQRVYGGNKSFDLRCKDCDEQIDCPESPFNLYYRHHEDDKVKEHEERMCLFSEGIENEDMSNCIIEYENGTQASYTQNFFARHGAARRGARLYGHKGTIQFDWYANRIDVFKHQQPTVHTIEFKCDMPHFGGDRELAFDFLLTMRDGRPSRSPMCAGIDSALTCLWARESARTGSFCDVVPV